MRYNHLTPQDEREIVEQFRRQPYQAVKIGDEFEYRGEKVRVVAKRYCNWEMLAMLSNGVEIEHHDLWKEVNERTH